VAESLRCFPHSIKFFCGEARFSRSFESSFDRLCCHLFFCRTAGLQLSLAFSFSVSTLPPLFLFSRSARRFRRHLPISRNFFSGKSWSGCSVFFYFFPCRHFGPDLRPCSPHPLLPVPFFLPPRPTAPLPLTPFFPSFLFCFCLEVRKSRLIRGGRGAKVFLISSGTCPTNFARPGSPSPPSRRGFFVLRL